MNRNFSGIIRYGISSFFFLSLCFLFSCASIDPRETKVALKEGKPETKITSFDKALSDIGKATWIFGTPKLNIQSKAIKDDTGTAVATKGEIPIEISEMISSTLNSVGGNVRFIPFNPGYIHDQTVTGYSNFKDKIPPDVVITGGITEFDRGLETVGKNTEFDVETPPFTNAPGWVPGNTVGADAAKFEKSAFSRITVDFNMIDFQTMSGIPKMQAVNTVMVHKAVAEKELGFSLFGPTFGLKGTVKKVQGRHAAVRLLVHLSMIQMLGKYLGIPYWNLLPDAPPDPVVIERIAAAYYRMNETEKIAKTQEFLYIQGYDNVYVTGVMDRETIAALQRLNPQYQPGHQIDVNTFVKVYTSVPVSDDSLRRRYMLASRPAPNPAPASQSKPESETSKSAGTYPHPAYEQTKSDASPLSFQTAFVCRPGGTGNPVTFSNRATLHSGDYYKISIKPDDDCYVYVFQADSSGQFYQLFPLMQFKGVTVSNSNPLQSGITRTIPAEDKSFVLDRKTGTERIYLAASRTRNMELENLYAEITRAVSQEQTFAANRQLGQYFARQRGVAGIVSDEQLQAAWKEIGDIFSVMSQRLEKVCRDCVYVLEFYHR